MNPAGTFLYATAWEEELGVVYVIDTQTSEIADEITVGEDPFAVSQFIGPAPALSLSRDSINFGSQKVDTISEEEDVILTNIGSLELDINNIDISAADFSITDDCPISLLTDASCTVSAIFEPLSKGAQTATVTITTNTNESPHTITLKGNFGGGGCSLIR